MSFSASELDIIEGDTITLSWETQDADEVTITTDAGDALDLAGADAAAGSVDVTPAADVTYTLTAIGEEGSTPATEVVSVTVSPPPVPGITFFTATPDTVALGETSTLAWETTNVTEVTVTNDAGTELDLAGADPIAGSIDVTPTATTTYTLVGTGRGGEVSETATITVLPLPVVDSFTIDPETPSLPGAEFTLAWTTTDTDQVVITDDQGVTVVDTAAEMDGSVTVTPEITTVYTLVASGPGGSTDAVEVTAMIVPVIDTFTVDKDVVRAGDTVTLTWAARGATEGTITGPDGFSYAVPAAEIASGTTSTAVNTTGAFELTIVSGTLDISDTVSVTVTDEPRVRAFTAIPNEVTAAAGQPVTVALAWDVDGADSLTLESDVLGALDISTLPVDVGTLEVAVEATQTFSLTAINTSGQHVMTAQVIAYAPPAIESLVAMPTVVGAGESVTITWNTTDAVSVTLAKDGADLGVPAGDVDGSYTDAVVAADAEYTLVALNTIGAQVTQTVTVTVGSPVLVSFTATPDVVQPNESVTLAWEIQGGTSLDITDAAGASVAGCGSADPATIAMGNCTVNPAATETYTLTVTNASGTATADAEVTVTDGPVIRTFASTASIVTLGGSFDLSWTVDNDPAGAVPTLGLVDDQGNDYTTDIAAIDPNNGTFTVTPAALGTYTFTLTASTTGTAAHSQTTAVDVIAAPEIQTFVASEDILNTANGPSSSELSWTTVNASMVELWEMNSAGSPVAQIFTSQVPAEVAAHTFTVSPSQTTEYQLIAINDAGDQISAALTVSVDIADIISFTISEPGVAGGSDTMLALSGDQVELEWETADADMVVLQPATFGVQPSTEAFIDISANASATQLSSLSTTSATAKETIVFPAGFEFPYFGTARTEAQVVVAGYINFDTTSSAYSVGDHFPDTGTPNGGVIAAFQDYIQIGSGSIWHDLVNIGGLDAMVIMWKNLEFSTTSENPADLNFEIILYETGMFELRYGTMDGADPARAHGDDASIGFENDDGTEGYEVGYNVEIPGLPNSGYLFDPSVPLNGTYAVTAEETTTFELTALNANGGESAEVTLTVWPFSFTVEPTVIELGTAIDIGFSVVGATEVYVASGGTQVGDCFASGPGIVVSTCTFTPTAVGTYDLQVVATDTASGASVTSSPTTVTVYPVLELSSFTATPQYIAGGSSTDLTWSAIGSDRTVIQTADGTVVMDTDVDTAYLPNGGTFTVTPAGTTTYTLVINDTLNSRTREASITVFVDAATVESFTVSEVGVTGGTDTMDVLQGTTVELEWATTNADGVIIEPTTYAQSAAVDAFVDISTSATAVELTPTDLDDGFATFAFPGAFAFPYFGELRTGANVRTNGFIVLDQDFPTTNYSGNDAIPDTGTPEGPIVAPFWDDLHQAEATNTVVGSMWYDLQQIGGIDALIIMYKNYGFYDSAENPSDLNFEVILYADGRIEYRYGTMTGAATAAQGSGASIGFENDDGTVGHQVSYNTAIPTLANSGYIFDPRVANTGTAEVTPTADTTYVLIANNGNGGQSAEVTVRVWPDLSAAPLSLNASPSDFIQLSESIELSWSVNGATESYVADAAGNPIPGCTAVGDPTVVGSCTVTPTALGDQTFTLYASNPAGVTGSSAPVTVSVVPYLAINGFAASSQFAASGDTVTLAWSSQGANVGLIQRVSDDSIVMALDATSVLGGTVDINPTATDEYLLTIQDTTMTPSRTRTATLAVYVDAAVVNTFTASATQVTPGESVTLTWDTDNADLVTLDPPPPPGTELDQTTDGFIDISSTGNPITFNDDDYGEAYLTFPSAFAYPYFGTDRTEAMVAVDGFISFDMSTISTSGNEMLPDTSTPSGGVIAAFWDDHDLAQITPNGSAYWQHFVDATGPDYLVIQWKGWHFWGSSSNPSDLNFEMVLYDDGTFDLRYGTMSSTGDQARADGDSATIGYENDDGTMGGTISHNTEVAGGLSNRGWHIEPGMPVDGSIVVTPTETTTYELCAAGGGYTDCQQVTVVVPTQGNVMFTELMIDPAAATDPTGEWVELRNVSQYEIDISGWTLSDGEGTYTLPAGTVLGPRQYYVVAYSADSTSNGGITPGAAWGTDAPALELDNSADEVILALADGTSIDTVVWDVAGGWMIPTGASLSLDPSWHTGDAGANDYYITATPEAVWCDSAAAYGDGDLGTPGTIGNGCRNTDVLNVPYMVDAAGAPFMDISATGMEITAANGDDVYTQVSGGIGFDLPFFNETVSDLWVSSNGFLSFADPGSSHSANDSIPNTGTPNGGVVAAWWDDLDVQTDGSSHLFIDMVSVGPNMVTIVQWDRWMDGTYDGWMTFQVQLWDNGDIVLAIDDVKYLDTSAYGDDDYRGSGATTGIEDLTGDFGIETSYNDEVLVPGFGVRFIKL